MDVRALCFLFLFELALANVMKMRCHEIKKFVDGHNLRRLSLAKGKVEGQPPASEMKSMVWDKELEQKAAAWAAKEQYGHNPDRTISSGRFVTGENIYMLGTTNSEHKFNVKDALNAWWEEHKDYTFKPMAAEDFQSSKQVGHYTQMAWSDSTHLGCAVARFWQDKWLKYYVVCNYGPTGNYLGQKVYPDGKPSNQLVCGVGDCSHAYGPRCSG